VLVDKDGLIPGEDWNHRLNLWLAECHVSIVLFSKRAIEKSDWVAKEAAVLSWRAELDKDFTLIPVLLDGETTPEDLARDFFGVLKIDRQQCIRNAATAPDILRGLVENLGEPEDLSGRYPDTPLERLQASIAKVLAEETTSASLQQALAAVGIPITPGVGTIHERCANLLARRFLDATADEPTRCFRVFKDGLAMLKPEPDRHRAEELFRYIRALWVEPGDAAPLRMVQQDRKAVALNGRLIGWTDDELKTECYTLKRFIERAWLESGADKFVAVPLTEAKSVDAVKGEIRSRILGGAPLPPGPSPAAVLDRAVNRDGRTVVLLVPANADTGGLPDHTLLEDLNGLFRTYERLLVVIDLRDARPPLPDSILLAQPRLDDPVEFDGFFTSEYDALLDERATTTFLDQKYGNRP